MDAIILQEYSDAGQVPSDILLWFQRHGARGVNEDYHHLTGANALMRYAMQRAASEIWRELDHERYAREKAQWEQDMSAPYGVLRRMFWGRFRHYWNPARGTGELWLRHRAQMKERRDAWYAQHCEDRRRGAEKRRAREQEQIDRLGVAGFNQRMGRQKQESIQIKAAKVDRTGKEFLRFLDWRQGPGVAYNTPHAYMQPNPVFQHESSGTPASIVSISMQTPSELYSVLCRLATEKKPVCRVDVTLMQTTALETVPTSHMILGDGRICRLTGVNRLPDFVTRRLVAHIEKNSVHFFGWGETATPFIRFPLEWRKYEGLEAPLGNPQKKTSGSSVRMLKGCIVKMTVVTQEHVVNFRTGASQTALDVDQVLCQYFQDPFERERQKTLAARRERVARYRLPVAAAN